MKPPSCCTETAKPDGKVINLRKSTAFQQFRVLFQFGRAFPKRLAKPLWKPRGNEDSVDLTVFHLNAF